MDKILNIEPNMKIRCKSIEEAEALVEMTGSERKYINMWSIQEMNTCYKISNTGYIEECLSAYMCAKMGEKLTDFSSLEEKYQVVFTEDKKNIGLLTEKDKNGNPKKILAKYSSKDKEPCIGGVEYFNWFATDIYLTPNQWFKLSRSSLDTSKPMHTDLVFRKLNIDATNIIDLYLSSKSIVDFSFLEDIGKIKNRVEAATKLDEVYRQTIVTLENLKWEGAPIDSQLENDCIKIITSFAKELGINIRPLDEIVEEIENDDFDYVM